MPRGRPKKIKEEVNEEVKDVNKRNLKDVYDKRKDMLREAFLKCVDKYNSKYKFDYLDYMNTTGGHGYIPGMLKERFDFDPKLFRELLRDLCNEGFLYHVGGRLYTKVKQ